MEAFIRDGHFQGCSQMGEAKKPPFIMPVTYISQLYLVKGRSKKDTCHVRHPLSSADIQHFFTRNLQLTLNREIQTKIVFSHIICNSFNNFHDASKIGFSGPPKIKVSFKRVYDAVISVRDVTNQILSLDTNYIAGVVI